MAFGELTPEVMQMLLARQQEPPAQFPFAPSYGVEPAPDAPQRSAWDSIAMGLAAGLPQMPAPRGAGASFARGLAQGFAMPRAAQVRAREEGAAATAEDRRKQVSEAARELRRFQNDLRLEAAKAAMRPQAAKEPDGLDRPIPDGLRKELGISANIATYRDLNELQQRDLNTRIAKEHELSAGLRTDAANDRAQAAADKKAVEEADIEGFAADVASFVSPPEIPARDPHRSRKITLINRKLRESGSKYNYDDLVRMSEQQRKFQGNAMNTARMSQLRQSASTVLQHMDQWDELWKRANEKLRFTPIRATNEIVFTMAKNGLLGEDAASYAVALGDVTSPAVAREAAYVLSGGYAPYEQDVTHSQTMVAPWLGGKVHERQYKALRDLLRARLESAVEGTPYAGGKDNPYLLEPSPLRGWERKDAKKRDMSKYEGN